MAIDHRTLEQNFWHALNPADAAMALRVDPGKGLQGDETTRRLETFGANALPEKQRPSSLGVFLHQFQSPLICILFVAAVLAFALGHRGDAGVILVVVVINALIGCGPRRVAPHAPWRRCAGFRPSRCGCCATAGNT